MDILIIADNSDLVAVSIASEARRLGYAAVVSEHINAARLFTVSGNSNGTHVTPDVPMLFRPSARPIGLSSNQKFVYGECVSILWSAAALATSPVINRPSIHGFEGKWSSIASITERRALTNVAPEIFMHLASHNPPSDDRSWAVESASGKVSRWLASSGGERLCRARPILTDECYEQVVVLTPRAWRTTSADLNALGLEGRSIEMITNLGLSFAVVTWGINADGAIRLVRVDPYPHPDQLQPVWSDVAPALLQALIC